MQKAEGPVRYIVQELYRPIAWPEADSAAARLLAEPGSVFISSTMLPHVANVPKGSWKTGSGAPYRIWEPCRAASQDPPVMKSLPARARVALPMAQSWVKLAAVPR
jgi:hypothetical protein